MATLSAANVFVYGTLMAEEVVTALLGRMPVNSAAMVKDYKRFSIVGRQYPAIIPVQGSSVRGKVMFDLTPAEMHILDLFEDEEYTREVVTAMPLTSTAEASGAAGATSEDLQSRLPCEAGVYVWSDRLAKELQGEWSYEEWRRRHLIDYVEMCKTFPEEGEGMDLRLQLEGELRGEK